MNSVYGCILMICLSGGFCSKAIISRSIVVQFGFGICVGIWSHALKSGLMVTIRAYSIRGGG